jgi:hypothetical protein
MMSSTGCLIVMPLVASDRTMLACTIERYPSLPELMAAVYDRSPAMAVLESLVDEEGPPKALPSSRFVL